MTAALSTLPYAELRERLSRLSRSLIATGDPTVADEAAERIATLETALAAEIAKRWNAVHPHYTELEAQIATLERDEAIRAFAAEILHGDVEHREWLTAAAEAFIAGTPLPPPNGKGRAEAAESSSALLREALTPFANSPYAALSEASAQSSMLICDGITVGDLRKARAALAGGSDGAEEQKP